jgi:hypothetical protein
VKVNAFTNLLIDSRRYADIKKIYTVCLTAGAEDRRQRTEDRIQKTDDRRQTMEE